jgi:hypothetical protein
MPDTGQYIRTRTRGKCRDPAHEVRPDTKYHDDSPVVFGCPVETSVHLPSTSAPRKQCRRRRAENAHTVVAQPAGFPLAFFVCFDSTGQDNLSNLRRLRGQVIGRFHGPQSTANIHDFRFLSNAFVTQKLRLGAIGRICQILDGALAYTMPARGRLIGALPKKREARVRVPIKNHVAGEASSAWARS